ncbi:MAG: exodeoxyribonuclease VII small subunit [Candidatus Cloacimonetes bacterium HGW-Cloacimonetes-2]|jgi:exodeoxyribonuclease VII small subunit|nr:MAG: exodeoxyribonuclease VII small subunit [Candidatus Cloacimonetes bacterium HGW-Cloacimonetes-2]
MEQKDNIRELSFEKALTILEEIAEKMASDNVELEQIMSLYEKGMQYLKHCRNKLSEAEAKLSSVEKELLAENPREESDGS